ncbi:phosphoglycerate mutase-like protein [Mycena olivaceomarginata]|nr:phosphoglycerate mutase-like protein [Mycena olivaceomarginata]
MNVEHTSREFKLPHPQLESLLLSHQKVPAPPRLNQDSALGPSSMLLQLGRSLACSLNTRYAALAASSRHNYPPPTPTNAFPSMFPTDVGYAGKTPTGAEPAVVATAPSYPVHTGAPLLVTPDTFSRTKGKKFDLLTKWGNLSPWHGARYPTAWASYGGPAGLPGRLNAATSKWRASGELEFLNEWTYKLGEEVLTPFGRQQLFDLGISMRFKYGFLLKNFTESNTLPVFRTESQGRMLASAQNFAIGFFGYPFEGQYQQSITIEGHGFNNTLAPYNDVCLCPNAQDSSRADRGREYLAKWASVYLKKALRRLQRQLTGYNLTIEDVYVFQQLCAYETVALGYSKFCELFTKEEWNGFEYSFDLYFWYNSGPGFPLARSQGIGYVQELSLYVDATHEVVILNVLTALNLSTLAAQGPLPADHIRSTALLECTSVPGPQIRIIVNDGVVPLTGIAGCAAQKDGMCAVDAFVAAQKKIIGATDWAYDCYGNWTIPDGWETTTGEPPRS